MPGTPQPFLDPSLGRGTSLVQGMRRHEHGLKSLAAARQQGNVFDQWMNTVQISGTNLNQVVTIGAAFMQGGVEVWTGFVASPPTAGTAVQTDLAIGDPAGTPAGGLTVTEGSTAATLVGTTSGTFTGGGNVIGAVDADGNDVLTPGTTYTISGTSVTLSLPALASGTSLYCASCVFSLIGG